MAEVKIKITADDVEATRSLTNVQRSMQQAESSSKSLGSAFEGLTTSVIRLAGPAAMGLLAKSTIDAALATERYTAAMEATAGSSLAAAREIQFIREESERLGLNFVETAVGFAKFSAATKNTTVEGEATRKIFVGVSEAVTALKLSGDDADGIFRALSQMMSKGKVSAEELNGQLGERLPGALKLAADAMGLTTAELMKQMEQGKLMSSDVLPKLAEQLHKTYGEAAKKSAEGGQASINRFNNEIKATASAIGSSLMPALTALGNKAASVLKSARENPPQWLKNLTFAFGGDLDYYMGTPKKVDSKKPEQDLEAEKLVTQQRLAAEAAAKAKQAAIEQKKEQDKQHAEAIKAFQDKAKAIIDIERDRVKRLLDIEKEYGKKLQDTYKQRVSDLEAFSKTAEELNTSMDDRRKARAEAASAALRVNEDDYQRYYRQQDEAAKTEQDLDKESPWSVEGISKKLKSLNELVKTTEARAAADQAAGIQNISNEQIAYDQQLRRDRIETKISETLKEQTKLLEDSAVKAATESDAWQKRIDATEDKIRVLDQLLQNLPRVKNIDVNLNINGMAALQGIPGLMANASNTGAAQHFGDYYTMGGNTYWNDGTLAETGTSTALPQYANGTDYVPRTGPAIIHQGEKIIPAKQNTGGDSVTIQGGITIMAQGGTPDAILNDVARKLLPKLNEMNSQRFRRAA